MTVMCLVSHCVLSAGMHEFGIVVRVLLFVSSKVFCLGWKDGNY